MSSFSCPHLNNINDFCERIKRECVPGRNGCVLKNKVTFAIPAEERVKQLSKKKRSSGNIQNKKS